jgi:anti-sigma regulatory factor (Ser/Thr protein kinase)
VKQTQTFGNSPGSVAAARRFAANAVQGVPAETLETVKLMVSELATNCVRHADSQFDLTVIQTEHEIRVEATDYGGGEPTMLSPGPAEPTGRGLMIIDMLATTWGSEHPSASGKMVWFAIGSGTPSGAEVGSSASHPQNRPDHALRHG